MELENKFFATVIIVIVLQIMLVLGRIKKSI